MSRDLELERTHQFMAMYDYFNNPDGYIKQMRAQKAVLDQNEKTGVGLAEMDKLIAAKARIIAGLTLDHVTTTNMENASLVEKVASIEKLIKTSRLIDGKSTENIGISSYLEALRRADAEEAEAEIITINNNGETGEEENRHV